MCAAKVRWLQAVENLSKILVQEMHLLGITMIKQTCHDSTVFRRWKWNVHLASISTHEKKKKKSFSDSIIGSGYDLTSSKARIVDKYGIIAPFLLRLNLYQPFFLAKVW